ncbi:MAG: pyrroloquinoline quinone biosynthesis protein PqqD [Candidatus Entotheonella factor]|uniref:Pyrroloquinoline quinone biosynthesis protein PqqD n=1 Tax=Entotheonella factor TaxID=1429438 RepID=W4L9Q5_ENTF1|nr:MAG: pyrroloquinoline quinone biosynthesis protein PqqD [Candidatus Entotheonella factor]
MSESGSLQPDDIIAIGRYMRLQWEEAQDAFVLLYPEGMVELSETAGTILSHCNGTASLAQIINTLQQAFPEADLADDVREFLEDMYAKGWVRVERAG